MGWKYKCTYPGCPRVESWGHIALKIWEKWRNQQKKLRENIEIRGNKFQERGVLEAKDCSGRWVCLLTWSWKSWEPCVEIVGCSEGKRKREKSLCILTWIFSLADWKTVGERILVHIYVEGDKNSHIYFLFTFWSKDWFASVTLGTFASHCVIVPWKRCLQVNVGIP